MEILVDTFLHAQNGIIQPQLITTAKLRDMMREVFARWIRFSVHSNLELSRIITPIIFSQNSYLVYVLQIPLLQSMSYQLYKLQPFPMKQQDKILCTLKQ